MILEGIVTTLSPEDVLNIAPMGPEIDAGCEMERFVLRRTGPRRLTRISRRGARGCSTSPTTSCSWPRRRSGRRSSHLRPRRPADVVAGVILLDACRFYEFRVVELDDREDRTRIVVETVAQGRQRDFFGFNRAKHAVVEAAILATRAPPGCR